MKVGSLVIILIIKGIRINITIKIIIAVNPINMIFNFMTI